MCIHVICGLQSNDKEKLPDGGKSDFRSVDTCMCAEDVHVCNVSLGIKATFVCIIFCFYCISANLDASISS